MKGCDISEHNGSVDFGAIKAAGYEFVILRAGYGKYVTQRDKMFETNYRSAKAAGLNVGAYWYSYAETPAEAAEEAKACLEVIKGKQFEYPIYYDIEEARSMKQATANCTAFCDTLEAANYFAGVYANASTYNNCIDGQIRAKYTTWLAHWAPAPAFVAPLWQNSATGRIPGVSGDVDTDIANCDLCKIVKQSGRNGWSRVDTNIASTIAANPKINKIEVFINGKKVFETEV